MPRLVLELVLINVLGMCYGLVVEAKVKVIDAKVVSGTLHSQVRVWPGELNLIFRALAILWKVL
jgi:hypothetical protein